MAGAMKKLKTLEPVPLDRVCIGDGFWGDRLRVNREVSIPAAYGKCKQSGRIDAFKLDWEPGKPNRPHYFWDSDVAKWLEGAALSLTTHPDAKLERTVNRVADLIASAQQPDGYLNIYFTVVEPDRRWSNLRDEHELYCAGHLMEAAVAHHRATGRTTLLDAMCRYADYIARVFGRGRGQKRGYPGHEEIELGLVKLYRATGNEKYLRLSKYFVDERGRKPHYFDKESDARGERRRAGRRATHDYCQAHAPVRAQATAEGHAVRALYLYAGMADVAAETGDRQLLAACRKLWKNIVTRRMYVHGGVGSSRFGERFTVDYDLPNDVAYAETCAAIALVFFAHRMLRVDPDGRYADVMERALYNNVIAGVSLDGQRFFYDNVLAAYPGSHRFNSQKPTVRQDWFGCACCPTNIVRLLASLGEYAYSQTSTGVYVHLLTNSAATVRVAGKPVEITQTTDYPWDGRVRITVAPQSPATFTLAVRVPGWCRDAKATLNGKPIKLADHLVKGYLRLKRRWRAGDRVDLRLAMPVERIEAHPSVRQDAGRVALQRGPLVYCLEGHDNGKDLHDLALRRDAKLTTARPKSGWLKAVPVVIGTAIRRDRRDWAGDLYRADPSGTQRCTIRAIPYFMWANRGESEMLVWINRA